MRAQNELSPYFAEIERRADRALKGIREVRRTPKLRALPATPDTSRLKAGLILPLVAFLALFLD
ncbi:MAG: hypothetical protein JJ866_05460 [Roseibium sp.]|uniref:hypothetical protein n=1 Tax=Roseibium sp. TaxID=1936156 RepID=UPI001B06AA3F|nr:hypothetical protein [Roseibium sp.]MBO6891373.1 hypothetical protein [Roseibium sp.]MBO6929103.1 hypothetical protein [Roseibium sp.]